MMFITKANTCISIGIASISSVTEVRVKTVQEAINRYGPLSENLRIPNYRLQKFTFKGFTGYLNKDAHPSFMRAINELEVKQLLHEIKGFQGCYSPRFVNNTNVLSAHAFGLACDFTNKQYSLAFIDTFKKHGWCWGGYFRRPDLMHFTFAGWECLK